MSESEPTSEPAPFTWGGFFVALVPVAVLVALLYLNVVVFKSADNQICLVLATAAASVVAMTYFRRPWADLEAGLLKAVNSALQAILILMTVGMLIAAWIKSGVVPLLVLYGLELISPGAFLVTACLVCCIVSLATGSSWTTAGTVGVALMGVGKSLGIDEGMTAGAVVSGAYFGDKMSPLSDTTNLAPAMAGATLIEHVRHMIWTVTPALVLSLAAYAVLGGKHDAGPEALARVEATTSVLRTHFATSPWLLLPPALVLVLIARRFPALPALVIGTFSAVVLGCVVRPPGDDRPALDVVRGFFEALYGGYDGAVASALPAGADELAKSAAAFVDELFQGKGGMKGMLGTVALIFCALSFGGVMERSGMLGLVATAVLKLVRGTGSLVAATIITCFGINLLASDQYMAIVVPGRMYRTAFLARRLHPKNLSRCLEDSGTVTSALIPWNTCGASMERYLGVGAAVYGPYAILNYLCPIVSIVYGFTGFSIVKISDEEAERALAS